MRGTFTHLTLDFSKDVLHLADLGFKQISVEPVVAEIRRIMRSGRKISTDFEEYDKLAAEMVKEIKPETISTSSIL